MNTNDICNIFKDKYKKGEFRVTPDGTRTVEIQNAHFIADKDYIVREPNYEYAAREIEWYKSMSLYVKDIPGKTPKIWEQVADADGKINSNYGWCIFSDENGNQYDNCLKALYNNPASREALMIYTRPSMYTDAFANGMHDFMCTCYVHCFLDFTGPIEEATEISLRYIVYQRSSDSVFGFDNDHYFHKFVYNNMIDDLCKHFNDKKINQLPIEYNMGSIHVYERHFKFLED